MKKIFVDEIRLFLKAGNGGSGIIDFLHYPNQEKGGPSGGDGGNGGDIYFRVNLNVNSFLDLSHKKKIIAENGENGKN
ncbi:hypothetical protein JTY60_02605 [symbiont of Argiope bruennichi]|uniref:hypothetical protein n=1 Tax=symbiont of Argiope bruennichi TaxID=2810479 RepID=UPI003DA42C52